MFQPIKFYLLASIFTLIADSALACKMTPESALDHAKEAITERIKKTEGYKGFDVKNIKHAKDFYLVDIKRSRTKKTLKFKVNFSPDCKAHVQELPN